MRSAPAEGPAPGPPHAVPAGTCGSGAASRGKYRPECAGLAATEPGSGAGERGAICGECLMLCAEIITERES